MFLKAYGIKLSKKGDAPSFVNEDVEVFEQEDLDKFFAACTPEEWLLFQMFLCTGLREQELTHLYISDIRFESSVVRVSAKPEYGWAPKKYTGREIPLPTRVLEPLREYVAKRKDKSPLLFPTSGGKPHKNRLLKVCKKIAKRAGLDTNDWHLHKFRATFATTCLQNGVDLATVQAWMGHTDLASTMRYLRPARGLKVKQKIDEVFA
jgi:integrase